MDAIPSMVSTFERITYDTLLYTRVSMEEYEDLYDTTCRMIYRVPQRHEYLNRVVGARTRVLSCARVRSKNRIDFQK